MFAILMGIGFAVFAVWAYFEVPGFFSPYFLGVFAVLMILLGIFRLGRKEQFPRPVEQDQRQ